ncbi:MAG: O-methyltransferase [Saprospiraceae bacterium]|jgi:predicted O-methyltransferase YrrM|nr:O-methyltransferase [Saprospiraceae bacterium]MBL0026523.1 O-methyltransferase [Saprospiraceae bacterium]
MQDLLDNIYQYSEKQSKHADPLLMEIERATHLNTLAPRMLSGHLQGSFLTMLSKLKQPDIILEIGTFTGYSAICLAKGLKPGGKLYTIEYDPQHAELAGSFIGKSAFASDIEILIGDAREVIPEMDVRFDLVFIDADKESYSQYYDLVIDHCNSGALILADNVLWSGKVLDEIKDNKTQCIHDFNNKILNDPRVENLILPLRDGINMIRKI